MDLFRFKVERSLLDNVHFLQYFAALNACHETPQAISDFTNEFKRPKILAFYKEKAEQILAMAPTTVKITLPGLLYQLGGITVTVQIITHPARHRLSPAVCARAWPA